MARSNQGDNGSDEVAGRDEGGQSEEALTGAGTDGNADMLRAILAKLEKLDEIETAVQSVSARVAALEKGDALNNSDVDKSTASKKSHFRPLGDPEFATKRMLDVSVKGALEKYAVMSKDEATAAFVEDFEAWEQKHFQSADKKLVREIRDLLLEKGAPVKRAAFLQVSQALTEFRDAAVKSRTDGTAPRGSASEVARGGLAPGRPPDGDDGDSSGSSDHNKNLDDHGDRGYHNRESGGDHTDGTRGNAYRTISPKPADVAKALPRDAVYQGGTMENIRRKYNTFTTACRLAGLDLTNESQIIDVMAITWLKGAARSYWEDRLQAVRTAKGVVDRLEEHFLHTRARRINEERWNALTYQLVRSRQLSQSPTDARRSHESTLNILFADIDALADLRVSAERTDESILSKMISAVRAVELFRPVCLQPPSSVEEMKTLLRGLAVEADNKALLEKTTPGSSDSFVALATIPGSDSEEQIAKAFYIDRKYLSDPSTRKVPGYGARYSIRRREDSSGPTKYRPRRTGRIGNKPKGSSVEARIPKGVDFKLRNGTVVKADQCIVCFEFGCHSSRHKKAGQAYLAAMQGDGSSSEDEEQEDPDGTVESTGYACFVSDARVCAYLGVGPTEPKGLVGMIVDTGASVLSTVGEKWLPTLRRATGSRLSTRQNAEDLVAIQGVGSNKVVTIGSFECPFYFGHQSYAIRVFVVPGYSPFLLSHKDMDRIGISYHSLEKKVVRPDDGYEQDVIWHNSLPFLPFYSVSFLSEAQLKRIHRSLGHAPTDKVVRLLEVADESLRTAEIREALKRIAQECRTCSLTQPPPQRFLFSSRYEGIGSFNSTIFVDVMSLSDGNVLHVVCSGTGYHGASFLANSTPECAWKALCQCWLYVYSGAPDDLYHDPGTNFASAEFRNLSTTLGITVHEVPTEAHHAVGAIERKHAMLRTVYDRLSLDEPSTPREEKLQLALRCVNDAPGPGGISPTMLVFGVIPKLHMPRKRNASLDARVRTIRECTILAKRLKAQRVRDEAARRRHVPNLAHIRALEQLVPGDTVLVYREKEGWKSYPFVGLDKDSVAVQLPKKVSRFAITSCRPANLAPVTSDGDLIPIPKSPPVALREPVIENPPLDAGQNIFDNEENVDKEFADEDKMLDDFLLDLPLSGITVATISPGDLNHAREKEMQGLYSHGTFTIVPEEKSIGYRLYNHKWVDKVKADGTLKSRFTVQAFNDKSHGLLTFAPTIQRQSLRMILSVGAAHITQTRDVTQAFVQAESNLRRPVFVRPPPEMDLPRGFALEIHRPLYGMPEAPLHWFLTYARHHKDRLKMKALCGDACVLYTQGGLGFKNIDDGEEERPRGIVGLQVDDSLICGNNEFIRLEEKESKRFLTKEKSTVGKKPTLFNGLLVWRDDVGDILVRCSKQEELEKYVATALQFEEFRSVRARCAYVAHSASPLVLYDVARLSQVTPATFGHEHTLDVQRVVSTLPQSPPLRYHAMLTGELEIAVCMDASFASNEDMSSQLGVICVLREKDTGKCNVIHYVSVKSKRVCRSVLVAELLAMIEGYDIGFAVRNAMTEMTGTNVPLTLYTDSQSLYHLAVSLTRTRERRMQIDLQVLREAYEKRDITSICWISGDSNPADGLTKRASNNALLSLLQTSTFTPETKSSIHRDVVPVRAAMCQSIHKVKKAECGAI